MDERDLIRRLREEADKAEVNAGLDETADPDLLREAADAIERLIDRPQRKG
jgi:hypothetical protein